MRGPGLKRLINQLANDIFPNSKRNLFNESFLKSVGGTYTAYDNETITYIEKGYNVNPIVYAVINQMATKSANVPFYIKEIKDKQAKFKLDNLMRSTKGDLNLMQRLKYIKLESKAFAKEDKPFPMERPNINQTWAEWIALYKVFLKTTGNVYIYSLAPDDGPRAGQPLQVYLLPSQHVQIIIKDNPEMLTDMDPIHGYIMNYGATGYLEFSNEDVIQIKYSNPNYDENGAHLYGQSPLQAALRNIQSSNEAIDLNIKTLRSGGAFGLIHGKTQSLTKTQADEIKSRLKEMDASPERLAKIAGVSAEIGFTRLSLTSDELKPFDYLNFDTKQICNVLIWSDKLLNNDSGAKYDNVAQYRKQVVTDNIQPDLKMLSEALNDEWLPRFKGYENSEIIFDIMELPEMQQDVKEMTDWLNTSLDRGVINRNEYRNAIHYLEIDTEDMKRFTVSNDIITLEEAIDNDFNIEDQTSNKKGIKAGFNDNQQRAADGQWGSGGADNSRNSGGDEYLSKEQLEFSNTIKNTKIEHLAYFCGGQKTQDFTGTANRVVGGERDLTKLCEEFSTIHNHPSGNLAMSWADLKVFVTSGDNKMIIVTKDGYLIAERTGDFDWSLFMNNESDWIDVRKYYDNLKEGVFWEYSKQYDLVKKTSSILGLNETQIVSVAKSKSVQWFMKELIKNPYFKEKIKLKWNLL